jgi:hypothetical protein
MRATTTTTAGAIDPALSQITRPARCGQPSMRLAPVNLNSGRSRRHFAGL